MSSFGRQSKATPFFLDGPSGRLFAMSYIPVGAVRGRMLFCPPFAEEMNKSRRMVACASRALADAGYAVLVVDPSGTGDSAGDFGESTWQRWIDDLSFSLEHLRAEGDEPVCAWGLRLGVFLALELAARHSGVIDRLVFWQPVVSGNVYMTQFLRLKIAAQMMGAGAGLTTSSLRAEAEAGSALEIAGYHLAPELFGAVDRLDLRKVDVPADIQVDWLEVASGEGANVPPLALRTAGQWREAGIPVNQELVPGEPFWATQEIAEAPLLIDATVNCIAG